MVTVVKFFIQLQNNFSKQEDSGDARTLVKVSSSSSILVFSAILAGRNAGDSVGPTGSPWDGWISLCGSISPEFSSLIFMYGVPPPSSEVEWDVPLTVS